MSLVVSELPGAFVLGVAFVFGAIWGSFFNVAIYRWPRDLSVVSPPSQCPSCGAPVAARFNLPILGYLMLRGKTACCGAPLSPRYPVVEALSAVLCVALARLYIVDADPNTPLVRAALVAGAYFCFVGGLIIATFVDLEHMEIPDEVSLPGAALGLSTSLLRDPPGAVDAALGAGAAFLVLQIVFVWSYEHLTGRRGMGEGDPKLMLMIGAFLGWQGALFSVFAGAAQGLFAYVVARVFRLRLGPRELPEDQDEPPPSAPARWGHYKVPFGPFLALSAIQYLFFGDVLVEGWFDLVQRVHGV